jgi:hypothetical protein
VRVVDAPIQIADAEALMLTLGATFTVMIFELVVEQPPAFVPVTE